MMMKCILLLLLFGFTWNINVAEVLQDDGSSGDSFSCGLPTHTALNCTYSERITMYQFDTTENRCMVTSICPPHATALGLHTTRTECEQACPATECPLPADITNGISYITRSHDGVVTAHYACFNSYNLVGSLKRTCLYNGSWFGDEPHCVQTGVVCEDPVNVAGAYKEYSCTSPGCLVVYSCKEAEGYQRVDGMGYRKCGENGKWINTLPTCTRLRVMQDESEISDEIKATKGQKNFEVRCIIEPGVPQSSVARWIRVGSSDVPHGQSHWLADNKSLALNFDTVNENDAGKYKCIVDGTNVLERSVEFVVISPMPTVTLLSRYSLVSSSIIILTCIFEAKSKPTVNWYKDGEKLSGSGWYYVSDKTSSHPQINFNVLEIYDTTYLGSYYCEANDDNSTQEWFLLQQSVRTKRSITDEKSNNKVLSTFDNICMDKTTGVYIGKIKRRVKGYTIIVQKELMESRAFIYTDRLLNVNNKGLTIPRHVPLSGNNLYIVVINHMSLVAYYPYSEDMESIITNTCNNSQQ